MGEPLHVSQRAEELKSIAEYEAAGKIQKLPAGWACGLTRIENQFGATALPQKWREQNEAGHQARSAARAKKNVTAAIEAGGSIEDMAELAGMSVGYFKQAAAKYGLMAAPVGKTLPPVNRNALAVLWRQNMTNSEIGDLLGLTPSQVNSWAKRFALPGRNMRVLYQRRAEIQRAKKS